MPVYAHAGQFMISKVCKESCKILSSGLLQGEHLIDGISQYLLFRYLACSC